MYREDILQSGKSSASKVSILKVLEQVVNKEETKNKENVSSEDHAFRIKIEKIRALIKEKFEVIVRNNSLNHLKWLKNEGELIEKITSFVKSKKTINS